MDKIKRMMFNRIVEKDHKPIGNIILNLCGCSFCEAFSIDNCLSDKASCTDFIDDFIRDFYKKQA